MSLTTVPGDPEEKEKNPPKQLGSHGCLQGSRRPRAGAALGGWGAPPGCFRPTFLRTPQACNRGQARRGTPGTPVPPRPDLLLRAKSPPASGWGRAPGRLGAAGSAPRGVPGVTCTAMAVMLRPGSAARSSSRPPATRQPLPAPGPDLSPGAEQGGWRAGERDRAIKAEHWSPGRARLASPPSAARFTLSQRWRPGGAPGQGRGGRARDQGARTRPELARVPHSLREEDLTFAGGLTRLTSAPGVNFLAPEPGCTTSPGALIPQARARPAPEESVPVPACLEQAVRSREMRRAPGSAAFLARCVALGCLFNVSEPGSVNKTFVKSRGLGRPSASINGVELSGAILPSVSLPQRGMYKPAPFLFSGTTEKANGTKQKSLFFIDFG